MGIFSNAVIQVFKQKGTWRQKLTQQVQQARDQQCVSKVDEKCTYDGSDQKRTRRWPIALHHGVHDGHGIGCGAQHEANEAAAHDSCVVIPTHDLENHIPAKNCHGNDLND